MNSSPQRSRVRSRLLAAVVATLVGASGLVVAGAPTAALAAATVRYVSSVSASCSNAGTGTSPSAPWCDFTPVNAATFGAGDRILLERGSRWNQELAPTGNGTAGNVISIDAYGSGNRPKIIRTGSTAEYGVVLTNPNHWSINNLEVGNAGVGILVRLSVIGNSGLTMSNIFVHDVRGIRNFVGYTAPDFASTQNPAASTRAAANGVAQSAGIEFATFGSPTWSPGQWMLKDVTLDNVEGTHNSSSFHTETAGATTVGQPHPVGAFQNMTFNHLDFHDDDGPNLACSDGLALTAVQDSIIMNSTFTNEGSCPTTTGTAAIYVAGTDDVDFFNNIVALTPNTGSPDQTGFDYEGFTRTTRLKGNHFVSNAGPGVEILTIHNDYSLDNVISGNSFSGNSSSVGRIGATNVPTGTIADNLSADAEFLHGSGFGSIALTNNLSTSTPQFAASQFSATQGADGWRYQSLSGSTWSDLGYYNAASRAWQLSSASSTPQVSKFEQHPGTGGNAVARAWTAPRDGTIGIRGIALKSDIGGGDGVDLRVTRNGTVIWPIAGGGSQHLDHDDRSGVETYLDNVVVRSGDVLRFETRAGASTSNDTVSWTPSIAYLWTGTTYQAEEHALAGGVAVATNNAGYTGSGFVDSWTTAGRSVTFRADCVPSGADYVIVRYAAGAGSTRTLSLYVNGTRTGQVRFAPSGTWGDWATVRVPVTFTAGINEIRLAYDAGDNGNVNIDSLTVSAPIDTTISEAERGVLVGVAPSTSNANFTGTGFTDNWTVSGRSATVSVKTPAAGTYVLPIRYANGTGTARTLSLYVGGVKVSQLSFPAVGPVGSWSSWGTLNPTVTLPAGASTVALKWDAGDNGNINVDSVGVRLP